MKDCIPDRFVYFGWLLLLLVPPLDCRNVLLIIGKRDI